MANVVALEPRPERPPPVVNAAEFRLDAESYSIEVTLFDDHGGAVILTFALASKPEGFDMTRLAEAWMRWRQASAVVA